MNFIFQITLTIFILLSFLMVLIVPYVCSLKNVWEDNKYSILIISTIWFLLVFILGALNSLVS